MHHEWCLQAPLYPKPFCTETLLANNKYPIYRRRQTPHGSSTTSVSNQNVVPYNPTLLLKYNCHVNVEVCLSFASVKYLFKYIHKGHDRIAYHVGDVIDEVKRYREGRYITVHEAAMRIMDVPLMRSSHNIDRLTVHEEGKLAVRFVPDATDDTGARILSNQRTTLMAYFALCLANVPDADSVSPRTRLYSKSVTTTRGIRRTVAFGNLANGKERVPLAECTPKEGERYYIWTLLLYRRGPTSYADLSTVDGILHATYNVRPSVFLASDEWRHCMLDVSLSHMPRQLRDLFVTLLVFVNPSNPRA